MSSLGWWHSHKLSNSPPMPSSLRSAIHVQWTVLGKPCSNKTVETVGSQAEDTIQQRIEVRIVVNIFQDTITKFEVRLETCLKCFDVFTFDLPESIHPQLPDEFTSQCGRWSSKLYLKVARCQWHWQEIYTSVFWNNFLRLRRDSRADFDFSLLIVRAPVDIAFLENLLRVLPSPFIERTSEEGH